MAMLMRNPKIPVAMMLAHVLPLSDHRWKRASASPAKTIRGAMQAIDKIVL